MNRSLHQHPVVARAATLLLVVAVSALVALQPGTATAQEAVATPLPTPVVLNATAAATNAALRNSLQNAQQQLQQGQLFQYQSQQQSVNNEFRARYGY